MPKIWPLTSRTFSTSSFVAVGAQDMKNFQDSWNTSYMKATKDFQDNWSTAYMK
jgi:hypothetical protein